MNAERILEKIGIGRSCFAQIICNDSDFSEQPFSKEEIFKRLLDRYSLPLQQAFSIGDRYLTDIEPMLKLGGSGVLVSSPESLPVVMRDMAKCKLETCNDYIYFPVNGDK